ncbi:type II toxin-antitoxin system RelE/ParE family toxin [Streptomyces sp. NPDC050704]|uniref:type II toxin-antitoxin system RelE/ParE family toxin n=1 Tax=Streptomyces sp. NPDC050704 TaxID=3157219 RepID=UPI00342240A9
MSPGERHVIDRAHRDQTPTIITRRDRQEAVVIDIRALKGQYGRRRLRVGDLHVVYTVENGQLVVWGLTVAHRRDVYRDL